MSVKAALSLIINGPMQTVGFLPCIRACLVCTMVMLYADMQLF